MVSAQNIIPRENVIPGAQNDGFHADGEVHCTGTQPFTSDVTFAAADIHGMNVTPLVVLEPMVGHNLIPIGVYLSKEANAYADGAVVSIQFGDAANTVLATVPLATMTDAAAAAVWSTFPGRSGLPGDQIFPQGPILMTTATAFTGAGGDVTVTVVYLEAM